MTAEKKKDEGQKTATENPLINEPYERVDRLNYKDRADRHVDHGDELYTERREWSNQAQRAVSTQQEEAVQDIRSQRDVMFSALMSERQQLFGNLMVLSTEVNANHVDNARRTAADAQTLSIKTLDTDTNEINSQAIGAEVAAGVAPVIGTAVEAAVAQRNQSGSDAQGITALNTAATTNLSQLTAAMTQAITALNAAVAGLQATAK